MDDIQRRTYLAHSKLSIHRRRVERASEVLRMAAEKGKLVVASSHGKDSVVLCDLALRALGPVPILHLASSYRLPGWEPIQEHFEERTTVHVVEPKRSLRETIEWLHEVGLGYQRTQSSRRAASAPKKDAGTEWCAEHGFVVQAMGLRAEENPGTRGKLFRVRGQIYQARGMWIACPLAWWTAQDIWAYLVEHGLPWHPLYDCESHDLTRETLRNSGWLTTTGAERGRIAWLRRHYPAQYEALAEEFPSVRMLT
jgi:phosphoadenosine phosphosulfate reductase